MNIVCLVSSLQLGGAERQLLGLAHILQEEGHKVEVLTYHSAAFYSSGISEYSLTHKLIEKRGTLINFASKTARHLDEFGCEVLIAYQSGASLKACVVKLIRPGMKLLVSERNLNLKYRPHDFFRFLCYRIFADKVICNSHSQEEFIRKHCPSLSDKVLTISNFVDTEKFSPEEEAFDARPHNPRRIVVTARISRRKNLKGLIQAAAILKRSNAEFTIDWYGISGENHYLERMRKFIHIKHLENIFHILPATTDVVSVYRNADIFCLPSFYEGTSNSLAEALSCGKPAVCSNVSDNSLYVSDGENGFLCDPNSPQSIADALAKAMALDGQNYASACRLSRRRVSEKLSVKDFKQAYISIL